MILQIDSVFHLPRSRNRDDFVVTLVQSAASPLIGVGAITFTSPTIGLATRLWLSLEPLRRESRIPLSRSSKYAGPGACGIKAGDCRGLAVAVLRGGMGWRG